MSRPLFGYKITSGKVTIIEDEAVIVRAVLGAPRGGRVKAAWSKLKQHQSERTIKTRIGRILAHAKDYLSGKPRCDFPADPAVAICP